MYLVHYARTRGAPMNDPAHEMSAGCERSLISHMELRVAPQQRQKALTSCLGRHAQGVIKYKYDRHRGKSVFALLVTGGG